ncbi:MAG: RnfH family protein [Methylomonas sp.]
MASDMIAVEVAYATPDRQVVIPLKVPAGSTVEHAIAASALLEQLPEIDLKQQKVGIFGQVSALDKIVSNGDRVEIYRPLQQNPMDARRGRMQK